MRSLSYGQEGAAMAGYFDEVGGPLILDEVWDLTYWLFWQSGAEQWRTTRMRSLAIPSKGAVMERPWSLFQTSNKFSVTFSIRYLMARGLQTQ